MSDRTSSSNINNLSNNFDNLTIQNTENNLTQSQCHGFLIENEIRTKVFKLESENNNTDKHDIPAKKNKFDNNENISIKTTSCDFICCGDISSFHNYDFSKKNTIIVVKLIQQENKKVVLQIFEIDYNKELHNFLFGNLPKEEIIKYVNYVKNIPKNLTRSEINEKYDYLTEKKKLEEKYNFKIKISPKVGINDNQRRVQCSIPKFELLLKDYITYKSKLDNPNIIRDVHICKSIKSSPRQRHNKST